MTRKENELHHYNIAPIRYSDSTNPNGSVEFFNNLKWMNSEEAAFYLRMTVGALRTAVCRGQVSARKFQRRLYFKRKDLDSLLENAQIIGGF